MVKLRKIILRRFFVPLLSSLVLLVSSIVPLPSSIVYAAVPHLINYQGRLTDSSGVPLNGSYNLTFRIYDAETAGSLLWQEAHSGVVIQKGIFSILLGSVTDLSLAFDRPYFLEIVVAGEVMNPRQRITSVGYAITAEAVKGVGNVFPGSGNVGIGTTAPDVLLQVQKNTDAALFRLANPAWANWDFKIQSSSPYGLQPGSLVVVPLSGNTDFGIGSQVVPMAFVVKNSGNVGIGTTSPGQKLTVAGVIESTNGGIKFPDGTVQTSAGNNGWGAVETGKIRDTVYQASSDGFIKFHYEGDGANNYFTVTVYCDVSTPPATIVLNILSYPRETRDDKLIPVKKNSYYKITGTDVVIPNYEFWPIN